MLNISQLFTNSPIFGKKWIERVLSIVHGHDGHRASITGNCHTWSNFTTPGRVAGSLIEKLFLYNLRESICL
jgi:hypothetical protein